MLLKYVIMNKSIFITFCVCLLFSCSGSQRNPEQEFFKFEIKTVDEKFPRVDFPVEISGNDAIGGPDCVIRDSLSISLSRGDCLFNISDIRTGESLGSFCRRGRALNEPLSSLPLCETYEKSGDLYADIFSMGPKLLTWNISESIKQRKDVYDDAVQFGNTAGQVNSWLSFYRLEDNRIIAYNSMQTTAADVIDAPKYDIYDLSNRELVRELNLFNAVNHDTGSELFTSKMFLSNTDCASPGKEKLFVGMSYMPVYFLLDIATGDAVGFKIKGLSPFSPKEQRWHFADVRADDKYIYALYSGEILFNPEGTDAPNVLYVIDWNGKIKLKCTLSHRFTSLDLDNGTLYLIHHEGYMGKIDTEEICSGIV